MQKKLSIVLAALMILGVILSSCTQPAPQNTPATTPATEAESQAESKSGEESKEAEESKETEESKSGEEEKTEASEESSEEKTDESKAAEETTQAGKEGGDREKNLKGKVWRTTGGKVATLNPHLWKSDAEADVFGYILPGLLEMVYDKETDGMKVVPNFAEELPTMSEDGKTWTFKIRKGLHWPDGEVIDAHAYEYSYKMLLDPKLKNTRAMDCLGSTMEVVNAKKYWLGTAEDNVKLKKQEEEQAEIDKAKKEAEAITDEAKKKEALDKVQERQDKLDSHKIDLTEEDIKDGGVAWEDVGIKALDDNTLEIKLVFAIPENDFLGWFMGGGPLSPVHKKTYEACMNADRTENSYGTSLETTPSCGSYILKEWVRDQYRLYEKNPDDEFAKKYQNPDTVYQRVVEDNNTAVQMFEKNETDVVSLAGQNYEKYEEDPRVMLSKSTAVWQLFVNMTSDNPEKAFLADKDFRQALYWAIDRETIATKINKKDIPAPYIVPSGRLTDLKNGVSFRESEVGKKIVEDIEKEGKNGFNKDKAKELFEKAHEKFGKKISCELMYFDGNETMKATAEFLKAQWEEIFGSDNFELKLRAVPWTQSYDLAEQGKYDITFGSWVGWAFNPWGGMDLYQSKFTPKFNQYANPEFDKIFTECTQGDLIFKNKERLEALGEMEKMILEDLPSIPLYEQRGATMYSDRVHLIVDEYKPGVGFAAFQADLDPIE